MSVNHSICEIVDLQREIGEVMRLAPSQVGWLAFLADRFGEVARAVYLAEDPQPTLLRLAACCHAWAEMIEEDRAK